MRRLLAKITRMLIRRKREMSPAAQEPGLTAVEYEAVALIGYEGQEAYTRACEQARYCRARGSEDGFRFWSEVAREVRLRTKGHMREKP